MHKAEPTDRGYTSAQYFELGLALGDLHLAAAFEAAIILDEIANAMPQLH